MTRRPLAATLAALVLAASAALLPNRVFAGYTTCDTDPTIVLSNGKVITLWAHMGSDVSAVGAVNFTLHIPTGLTVTSVTYDQYASLEHLTVLSDIKGGNYSFESDATVIAPLGTSVTAWASMANGNNTYSLSGLAGQTLAIRWG